MPFLQDVLHKLGKGGGMRYFRVGFALLAVVLLIGLYDLRAFRNMGTQEAMDMAQLARNIARGKGYTTLFIRPSASTWSNSATRKERARRQPAKSPIWPASGACIPTSPIRRSIRSCWPA